MNDEALELYVRGICKQHGLRATSLELHAHLLKHPGPHTLHELGEHFGMQNPAVSNAADGLIALGLVVEGGWEGCEGRRGRTRKTLRAKRGKPIAATVAAQARKLAKVAEEVAQ